MTDTVHTAWSIQKWLKSGLVDRNIKGERGLKQFSGPLYSHCSLLAALSDLQIVAKQLQTLCTTANFMQSIFIYRNLSQKIALVFAKKEQKLKGQSNEIFDLLFFSSLEPALATDQWVKIFSILVKNLQSYSNFKSKNLTPRGIIPRRVSLPRVLYPCESISLGYHTPASQ